VRGELERMGDLNERRICLRVWHEFNVLEMRMRV
jgi:hypothetical protein